MTNALIKSCANEIYAKIENPMIAIVELGKLFHQSAIMGVNTPGDGAVLALTCMCEGITPLEFAKTYHIIKGKPSMRADMIHAKFRTAGGKLIWKNTGDDGKSAEAEFTFDGQSLPIVYTIDDARKALGKDDKGKDRIDTPDGNWMKDRGAMLRARLITKAIRILAPELIAGVYTPEELDDVRVNGTQVRSESEIAARRAELLADASAPIVTGEIINTEYVAHTPPAAETSSAATGKAEQVNSPTDQTVRESRNPESLAKPLSEMVDPVNQADGGESTNDQRIELMNLCKKMPSPSGNGKGMDHTDVIAAILAACKVDHYSKATHGQMERMISAVRNKLGDG